METNQPVNAVSVHGPAVISLLAGNNIGTAPDKKIYYAVIRAWLREIVFNDPLASIDATEFLFFKQADIVIKHLIETQLEVSFSSFNFLCY